MKTQKSSNKSSSKPTNKPTTNTSNAQGTKVAKDKTVGAHVPASQQCEHKAASITARGRVSAVTTQRETKRAASPPARNTAPAQGPASLPASSGPGSPELASGQLRGCR